MKRPANWEGMMIKLSNPGKQIARKYHLFVNCLTLTVAILLISCDSGPLCVSGDTTILTPEGYVPVKSLKVGDYIMSYAFDQNILSPARITGIKQGFGKCIQFRSDSGHTLKVTADHPVYSPETMTYKKASSWQFDGLSKVCVFEQDKLKTAIATISRIDSEEIRVFDITVASPFNNFIANGILVHNKSLPPDDTPPVDDLEVVDTDSNSVTLAWTVPGNQNLYPVEYDLRYLDREWQADDFWTLADTVIGEPVPSVPGSRDTMTVENLQDSTTYWFGITTFSNEGYFSSVSNIVSDTTQ